MVVKEMKRAELHVIVSSNLLEIGEIQSKNGCGHEWSHGYLLKNAIPIQRSVSNWTLE